MAEANKKLEDKTLECERKDKELEKMRELELTIKRLEASIEDWTMRYKRLDETMKSRTDEINRLRSELQIKERRILELQREISLAANYKKRIEDLTKELEIQRVKFKEEVQKYKLENDRLKKEIFSLKKFEGQVKTLTERISKMEIVHKDKVTGLEEKI